MNDQTDLLHWEDFHPGQTFDLGSYDVPLEEIVAFARQYDPQGFHVDEEQAKASPFGGIVASGWHTGAISQRLLVEQLLLRTACQGSPGVDELRFLKPVRPDDVLRGRLTIVETRPSSRRPDRGTVTTRYELENQRGEVVLSMAARVMFERRDPAEGSGPPDANGS
jgi:acyl dehydratase